MKGNRQGSLSRLSRADGFSDIQIAGSRVLGFLIFKKAVNFLLDLRRLEIF